MKLETDPETVMRLAAEREEENWKFRSFLKSIDIGIEDLDAIVHKHYEDISGQIDCTSCANCCREVRIGLTGDDVARLASGLKISDDELIERFLAADEDGELAFNTLPCPLLKGNLCIAYDHRPEACRSYPHLHRNEFVFRLMQAAHNCSVCPFVFNVVERLKVEFSDGFENLS
jgi:Fe-S-cluster containining protein